MADALALLRHAGKGLLDLVLPPTCLGCDTPVDHPGALCAACFAGIGFIAAPFCDRCGQPFPFAGAAGLDGACAECSADPPEFIRARAALRYDSAARHLVLGFKHAGRTELAAGLAAHMARAGQDLLAPGTRPLLVPVPLHRRRLLARRYNQSALLAGALARRNGLDCCQDLLCRTRATQSLGGKTAEQRRAEVAGVFAVRPRRLALLAGRRVVLVDDVLTSGATARACARALLAAGAASVEVLALARVPDPRMG